MNKIGRNHIEAYITHLFFLRHQKNPPTSLIDKWKILPEERIDKELEGLYLSWNWSLIQGRKEEQDYLMTLNKVKETPPSIPVVDKSMRKIPRWIKLIIIGIPIVCILYISYQYYCFKHPNYLYALTNNIAIRDGNTNIVGRMDLYSRVVKNDSNSTVEKISMYGQSTEVFLIDGDEVEFNRVILDTSNFWGYLNSEAKSIGYVNASTVTQNVDEQKMHKQVFYNIKDNSIELKELKYAHRKIIVNCLRENRQLKKLQIAAPCREMNSGRKALGIIRQELVKDEKYCMIAKLDNGKYYRFLGDIKNDFYKEPEQVEYQYEDESDLSALEGDYLFKYNGKNFDIIDCSSLKRIGQSVNGNDGAIDHFVFFRPEPEVTPSSDSPVDLIDTIGSKLIDLLNL